MSEHYHDGPMAGQPQAAGPALGELTPPRARSIIAAASPVILDEMPSMRI